MAGRYGNALFELARDSKAVDAVKADLDRFDALIADNPDLNRLVRSPVFGADEQLRALAAILDKAGIKGLAANFLRVITTNRRLFAVRDMIRAYRVLAARQKGEVTAEVTVAEPLSDKNVGALKDALKSVTGGKDIDLDMNVDPAIIGGLIVKVGGDEAALDFPLSYDRTGGANGDYHSSGDQHLELRRRNGEWRIARDKHTDLAQPPLAPKAPDEPGPHPAKPQQAQKGGGAPPPRVTGPPYRDHIDLLVCETAPNGQPQNVNTSFSHVKGVTALAKHRDLPDNTEFTWIWSRDGVDVGRYQQNIHGTGSSWSYYHDTAGGTLAPGKYRARLLVNGKEAGTVSAAVH